MDVIAQERLIAVIQKTKDESLERKVAMVQTLTNGNLSQQQLQDELTAKKEALANDTRRFAESKYEMMRQQFQNEDAAYQRKLREMNGLTAKKCQLESDVARLVEHLAERSKM